MSTSPGQTRGRVSTPLGYVRTSGAAGSAELLEDLPPALLHGQRFLRASGVAATVPLSSVFKLCTPCLSSIAPSLPIRKQRHKEIEQVPKPESQDVAEPRCDAGPRVHSLKYCWAVMGTQLVRVVQTLDGTPGRAPLSPGNVLLRRVTVYTRP